MPATTPAWKKCGKRYSANTNVRVGAENGDPFFYAARTMINGKRLLQEYNMYFEEDNTLCFPIPAKEIEINSLAEQNPY